MTQSFDLVEIYNFITDIKGKSKVRHFKKLAVGKEATNLLLIARDYYLTAHMKVLTYQSVPWFI
jgi:hypothetical protein